MDPIEQLSDEQLVLLAADLQVQLEKTTAMRPVLFMLAKARHRARTALLALGLDVEPEDTKLIRSLQNEVKLYDDMVTACRELLASGKEAHHRISEQERDALDEVVVNMSDDERRLHGFELRGKD